MSSFTFRILRLSDDKVVREINALMKALHGKSEPLTTNDLIDILNRSTVVVAESDGVIVGVAMLHRTDKLSLRQEASIQTMYTSVSEEKTSVVFQGLIGVLVDVARAKECPRITVFLSEGRPQVEEIAEVLVQRGFRKKPVERFRLGLR